MGWMIEFDVVAELTEVNHITEASEAYLYNSG